MGFRSEEPILRRKQEALDVQDLEGSWRIYFQVGGSTLFSTFYTRIDQVFVVWSILTLLIFSTAQLLPLSWIVQAVIWSVLTLAGTAAMIGLTTFWARVERLMWVVYGWVALMIGGVLLTDLGIFLNWGIVLLNLCPLWLGLCAVGYLGTGIGMQSRTFLLIGCIHLITGWYVQQILSWQYLVTGLVIGGSLLLLAQVQWDMRSPIEYSLLTEEQKVFNREQHQLRQKEL